MNFGNWLLKSLQSGFNLIGDMIYKLIQFLAKPLSYIFYFIQGLFYFIYQLFYVVGKVIMIFVALIQFFAAIVAGFVRTVVGMLTIHYDSALINYPGGSYKGIQVFLDVVRPIGALTVIPGIVLAMVWFYFIKKTIGLIGSGASGSE